MKNTEERCKSCHVPQGRDHHILCQEQPIRQKARLAEEYYRAWESVVDTLNRAYDYLRMAHYTNGRLIAGLKQINRKAGTVVLKPEDFSLSGIDDVLPPRTEEDSQLFIELEGETQKDKWENLLKIVTHAARLRDENGGEWPDFVATTEGTIMQRWRKGRNDAETNPGPTSQESGLQAVHPAP